MSREYAEEQIRKALQETGGHPGKTRQKIIGQAMQDHKLLLGLTQGHLTGVVSLWVNRVITKLSRKPDPVPEQPEPLDMAENTFGKAILEAMEKGSGTTFGLEGGVSSGRRKAASKKHMDTMRFIARQSRAIDDQQEQDPKTSGNDQDNGI